MADNIEKILEELYLIDSSFRNHEPQLRKLIHTLLISEPDTKFDHAFAERLRKEILGQVPGYEYSWFSGFNMRLAFGGVIALLLIVPVAAYLLTGERGPGGQVARVDDVTVTKVNEGAFGKLSLNTEQQFGLGAESALSVSGDERAKMVAPTSMAMGMSGGGGAGTAMIAPDYIGQYTFKYVGGDFSLDQKNGIVLKRKKGASSFGQFADLIERTSIGIDPGKFSRLLIRNIDVVEDRDKGYAINVNFEEGMLSINPNWPYWDMGVREYQPLSRSEAPADSVIIGIANEFLKSYGIDVSRYGSPEIMDNYPYMLAAEPQMESLQRTTIAYAPDMVSVTYPLIVRGQKIYDQGGGVYGLVVTVDTRERKVNSLYNLTSQSYESSEYPLETNKDIILKVALRGGVYGHPWGKGNREVTLGTPSLAWMRHWQYKDGVNSELFVPALAFPIEYVPEGVFIYGRTILVPLVRDLIEEPPIVTPVEPRPMPMPEPIPDIPVVDSYPTPVKIAQEDLAKRLGVDVGTISVGSIEKMEWGDSCLGAGAANESCLLVITPGYRVVFRVGEMPSKIKEYIYHTDTGKRVILLE